ncbi:MAG: hypothetical protein ABJN95_16715 [Maribacter sp.]|uniref:hypothetical protein n=1 Tax=Maribacter sp. TaxID=1897614 RepID=UPI0032987DA0
MKGILLIFGFLVGLSNGLSAQDIGLSKTQLETVLCKQWQIEYALMGGMKIKQMPGAADFDFKFISDGKYDLIRKDGNNESGIWKYFPENKYVELSIKDKITSRIKSIDESKLILILVSGENDPPGIPNVEVHFKPI